ncbi:U6 snRNA-associated Sm-like protein LSm8 [Vanrija pseudolonga]|uniref:LSM2-LSM8 complex subunit LSM8 n=1 Tax=Vanrija pseudolonga TaxID=143232 RepID=A0AAF0Y7E3_9TREE|nr:U6 snRNA-associated Sm-like protein LSm8 [Vanrija pseudolonga]
MSALDGFRDPSMLVEAERNADLHLAPMTCVMRPGGVGNEWKAFSANEKQLFLLVHRCSRRRPMRSMLPTALQLVQVILYDGRVIVGRLKGNDNFCNLILSDSVEREYSSDKGVEMIPLGLYMIKGDNV